MPRRRKTPLPPPRAARTSPELAPPDDSLEWSMPRERDSPVWYEDPLIRSLERKLRGQSLGFSSPSDARKVSLRSTMGSLPTEKQIPRNIESLKTASHNGNQHRPRSYLDGIRLGTQISSTTPVLDDGAISLTGYGEPRASVVDQQPFPSNGNDDLLFVGRQTPYRPTSIDYMLWDPPTTLGIIGVLPVELQEMVLENLSWASAIHLAATNKWYRANINPFDHGTEEQKLTFLRSQEDKPGFNVHLAHRCWFACTGCWRLKLQTDFAIEEVTSIRKRKGGGNWQKRRCLNCQINAGLWHSSVKITDGGRRSIRLCKPCREFHTGLHCLTCHCCEECMGELIGTRCPHCLNFPVMQSDNRTVC